MTVLLLDCFSIVTYMSEEDKKNQLKHNKMMKSDMICWNTLYLAVKILLW